MYKETNRGTISASPLSSPAKIETIDLRSTGSATERQDAPAGGEAAEATDGSPKLQRGLKNRHIQLIAIGGAIGTGLFLGSGKTIHLSGPAILLVYAVVGFFLFFVMRAMGEILLSNLAYKSFADFATDLLGKWAGFYIGWTYWMCWVVVGIADTTAICGYLAVWFPHLPKWIPAAGLIVLLVGLNMVAVRLFGELEFWFSMIKVVTIIALIIVGFYLAFTGFHPAVAGAPAASITHLWDRGGFFATGFTGFVAGFQIAIFSFQGIELAGTAAAETQSPQTNLPKAINSIPVRVIIFYVLSLAAIMCVQPWDRMNPNDSPFVDLFKFIGFAAAFNVVNFVVVTSAASSANSGIYSTSRMMYGLALEKHAPKRFGTLSSRNVPTNTLLLTAICIAPAIILVSLSSSVMNAFQLVTSVSATLFITVWGLIVVCYLAYRRKYPERHRASTFKMPGGVVASWLTLAFFVGCFVALGISKQTRIALIAAPIWILFLIIMYRVMAKTQGPSEPIDFTAQRVAAAQAVGMEIGEDEEDPGMTSEKGVGSPTI